MSEGGGEGAVFGGVLEHVDAAGAGDLPGDERGLDEASGENVAGFLGEAQGRDVADGAGGVGAVVQENADELVGAFLSGREEGDGSVGRGRVDVGAVV